MNYHIGRLALSSLCVGAFGAAATLQAEAQLFFSLQNEQHQKPAAPKAPTHSELRKRRPMW